MLKRRSRVKKPQGVKTPQRGQRLGKRRLVAVVALIITVAAASLAVAYRKPSGSATRPGNPTGGEPQQSLVLAKEYIYAGGRLIATEEPASSSGCGTPPSSPGNTLVATALTATSVRLDWAASPGADHYEVQRRASINSPWVPLSPNPTSNTFTDNGAIAGTAYLYQVRAADAAGACPSAFSNVDLATTIMFLDDPLAPGVTIKAQHLTDLRTAVNAVRATANLAPSSWTDPAPLGVTVKAAHINELRSNLDAALTALGFSTSGYSDPTLIPGSTIVKAVHVNDLRQRVK
ncbi:MAG TPA: fibronectin type III domain-containing protein [Blastocatellia bacterium]|nr:fibronectin type III domain-containing protein [Blastocatellia bacterium]